MALTYFTDRVAQHPGRVRLTPVSGQTNVYDVSRSEGTVTEPGTPFNAATFNEIATDLYEISKVRWCYSPTAPSVQTKVVNVRDGDFELRNGAMIAVDMYRGNSYVGTTNLNVAGTGAKPIKVLDTTSSSTHANQNIAWVPYSVVLFVYSSDSDCWYLISGARIAPERITGTNGSAISSGNCVGWYDPVSGAVRLTFGFTATSNVGIDDVLFTIPSAYRPSEALTGVCVVGTAAGSLGSGGMLLGTDGTIKQRITSQARSGYGSIEYYI